MGIPPEQSLETAKAVKVPESSSSTPLVSVPHFACVLSVNRGITVFQVCILCAPLCVSDVFVCRSGTVTSVQTL